MANIVRSLVECDLCVKHDLDFLLLSQLRALSFALIEKSTHHSSNSSRTSASAGRVHERDNVSQVNLEELDVNNNPDDLTFNRLGRLSKILWTVMAKFKHLRLRDRLCFPHSEGCCEWSLCDFAFDLELYECGRGFSKKSLTLKTKHVATSPHRTDTHTACR